MSDKVQIDSGGESRVRSRWPKRLLIALIVLLPFGVMLQIYMYYHFAGSSELAAAIAEADRLDPNWRWEDLMAERKPIPDAENSALVVKQVIDALRGLGTPHPLARSEAQLFGGIEQTDQLNDRQVAALRMTMARAAGILPEARRLAGMPNGRHPIEYDPLKVVGPALDPIMRCRQVIDFLGYAALLAAQDNKIDEALEYCRAGINASRSIGDDPMLIAMLVRIACRSIALGQVERVLAQGQASEESLAALQRLLELDAIEPSLARFMRGERAYSDSQMQALQSGQIDLSQMVADMAAFEPRNPTGWQTIDDLFHWLSVRYKIGPLRKNRAALLRFNNALVEAWRLPRERRDEALAKLYGGTADQPFFVQMFAVAIQKAPEAGQRSSALAHSMIAAVAAERYRLKHGRWPGKATDLVPEFLTQVPNDPYGKDSIRMVRVADGLIFYCLGYDRKDDGGYLDRKKGGAVANTDIGFQLWNVNKRRQPPKALPANGTKE